jgi:hypothetical protein
MYGYTASSAVLKGRDIYLLFERVGKRGAIVFISVIYIICSCRYFYLVKDSTYEIINELL